MILNRLWVISRRDIRVHRLRCVEIYGVDFEADVDIECFFMFITDGPKSCQLSGIARGIWFSDTSVNQFSFGIENDICRSLSDFVLLSKFWFGQNVDSYRNEVVIDYLNELGVPKRGLVNMQASLTVGLFEVYQDRSTCL